MSFIAVLPTADEKNALLCVPLTVVVPPGLYTYTSSGGPFEFPVTLVSILYTINPEPGTLVSNVPVLFLYS